MKSGFNEWNQRVAVLFCSALWSAPFLVAPHTLPISTFYAESLAIAIAIVLAALAMATGVRKGGALPIAATVAAPTGFIIVLLVQLSTTRVGRPVEPVLAMFFALCAISAIQAGVLFGQDREAVKRLLQACAAGILTAGLLSSGIAWLQAFGLESHYLPWIAEFPPVPAGAGRRLFANLYQANHLGTVCLLAMASVVYLRRIEKVCRLTLISSLIILGIGAALTASRTPLIQAAVIVFCAIAMARLRLSSRHSITGWPRALLFGLLPFGVLILAAMLVGWINSAFELHLASSSVQRMAGEESVSLRIALWRYAIEVFLQHPLIGVGWGEYVRAQFLIADRLGPVEMANNAHNIVLDLLAKTGLIGAIVIFLPLMLWAWRVIHELRKNNTDIDRLYCLTMVAVVAVHAMLEFPQNYAFFLLPVCLLVGLAETRSWRGMTKTLSLSGGAALLGIMSIGLVFAGIDYRKAEVAYRPRGALLYFADPAFIYADWARYGLVSQMPLDKELLPEKISMHESALAISASPNFIRRYIILLALDGRIDDALLQVKRLRSFALGQFNQQYEWLVGMCDEQKGQVSEFKARLLALYGPPRPQSAK